MWILAQVLQESSVMKKYLLLAMNENEPLYAQQPTEECIPQSGWKILKESYFLYMGFQ